MYLHYDFCAPRGNMALVIYFNAVLSTASGHRWSPAATMYITFCGDTYIRNVTERQLLAQPERRKDKDHQQCFLFFVFCFFFTVVCKQELK